MAISYGMRNDGDSTISITDAMGHENMEVTNVAGLIETTTRQGNLGESNSNDFPYETNTKTGEIVYRTYDAENRYNADGQRIQRVEGDQTISCYYQDDVVSYTPDGKGEQPSQDLSRTDGNVIGTRGRQAMILCIMYITRICRAVRPIF